MNIQGTYREHTGNIQGTYREHTDEDMYVKVNQTILTLDSHDMPAIEMPSRHVTVMTPTMRMSLIGSAMTAPFS